MQVSLHKNIPTNAICSTLVFTIVLSLILIGSSTAFNIIASIGASSILGSYLVSISTITYRRITGYKLLSTRFSLGKFGLPINILALCFLWLAFVMVRSSAVFDCDHIADAAFRSSSQLSRIQRQKA